MTFSGATCKENEKVLKGLAISMAIARKHRAATSFKNRFYTTVNNFISSIQLNTSNHLKL